MNIDVATCLNCVYFAYIALIKSIKCIPRMYWVGQNNRKRNPRNLKKKNTSKNQNKKYQVSPFGNLHTHSHVLYNQFVIQFKCLFQHLHLNKVFNDSFHSFILFFFSCSKVSFGFHSPDLWDCRGDVTVYTDPEDFQANQYLTCLTSDLANLLVAEASVWTLYVPVHLLIRYA